MLKRKRRVERAIYPKHRSLKNERGLYSSISVFKTDGESKFSFTISKKTANTAVLRNKLRRVGYESIRSVLPKVKNGYIVRFSVHTLPPRDTIATSFKGDIMELLLKTDIISK